MNRRDDPARRARVAKLERDERTRRFGKHALYAAIALVVIAGAAYGISKLPKEPAQVHWHAKYQVIVNDQRVNFASPRFDGMKYADAHIHSPDFDLIHNEGREGRGTMGAFFSFQLGGRLGDADLQIPAGASAPGDYQSDANHTLVLLISNQDAGQNWTVVTSGLGDVNFHNGDRILVMYGNYTSARVAEYETAFPDFSAAAPNKTDSPTKPTG